MQEFQVQQLNNLLCNNLINLVKESKEEGFNFLERLMNEYKSGTNTFNKNGESLYGVFSKAGVLVAVGGLNIDPFSKRKNIGRLRRFYVAKKYRRKGLGKLLLNRIIYDAEKHFQVIVLRTNTEQADKFYTSLGFTKKEKFSGSTHFLNLGCVKA
ncbi:GNAT family N-acetyltransferase [Cytobacillus dafuensis]|uniref:GNAT family N-acetyltransferase n=1 Tax=Cytobacillus dafuensis TaxID=1742359 RepID=A0A5B8Z120_CYTDA|nr:GNAT family N-acetyltransferase [Cytobacillus dafuensis]QED46682.1 GNAT family N-acetyltransferase [Cytobacillus dafuensis]